VSDQNWRNQLESPRWGSKLKDGELPEHANVEMNPTSRFRSVLFWLVLGLATFMVVFAGYGSGFWHFAGG